MRWYIAVAEYIGVPGAHLTDPAGIWEPGSVTRPAGSALRSGDSLGELSRPGVYAKPSGGTRHIITQCVAIRTRSAAR
jgi:hypothetical protein